MFVQSGLTASICNMRIDRKLDKDAVLPIRTVFLTEIHESSWEFTLRLILSPPHSILLLPFPVAVAAELFE